MITFKSKSELLASARILELKNENNRLGCNIFAQLNLAPPAFDESKRPTVGRIFSVPDDKGGLFFVELMKYERIAFAHIDDTLTLLVAGVDAATWKRVWLKDHPNTRMETMLCVYFYMRLNETELIAE